MAVSLIRSAESHSGTTGSVSEVSFTFAVGQAGDAPKGILVFVFQGVLDTDQITSVTYGGTSVPALSGANAYDTSTEKGRCKTFFLGVNVPSGAPSGGVVVNRTNSTTTMYAVAYLLGGAANLRSFGTPYVLNNNAVMAQQSFAAGATTTQIFAAAYSGGVTVPTGTNMTIGTGTYLLYAAYAFFSGYETTPTTGTRTRGFICATDDLGYVILAVGEVVGYAATGQADAVSGLSGAATVKRAATGAAGAIVTAASSTANVTRAASGVAGDVVTGLSGTATVTEGVSVYPATGQADASTAVSGTATVKRAATGVVDAATALPSAALTVKRAATGSVSTSTDLSGAATAKHPATGVAGAVTTGTDGIAAVIRLVGTTPSIEVVTGLSGDATVTEAPAENYATGQVDVATVLSGTANVTRAATGSVTSSTTVSGAALAKFGVTGSVSSYTGVSGSATKYGGGERLLRSLYLYCLVLGRRHHDGL